MAPSSGRGDVLDARVIRQHSFYLEDEDWVKLRHLCLDAGISVSAFIANVIRHTVDDANLAAAVKREEESKRDRDRTPSAPS